MNLERVELLASLLAEARAEGMRVPNLPEPIWRGVAGLTPQLAAELLLTRDGTDVLLVWREDRDFVGWHVPGGWFGAGEGAQRTAARIARRELGVGVVVEALLDARGWAAHPYAEAVSLLCACRADGLPQEGVWFTEVPRPIVAHHDEFVCLYLAWLRARR